MLINVNQNGCGLGMVTQVNPPFRKVCVYAPLSVNMVLHLLAINYS